MIASMLFTWLQGADFYHDLHQQAIEALPVGHGETWLDIGCGPGLVARLAARQGYRVTGVDSDPRMIVAAKRIAQHENSAVDFRSGSLSTLAADSADLISAASLLAVLPDREAGLRSLWRILRLGGTLLIVEPTDQMTVENARRAIQNGLPRKRILGLHMWAAARQGNIVNPAIYAALDAESIRFVPLLQNLAGAWIIEKKK